MYTIWRSEYAQYKSQALPYKKNATEWEILGELAQRLHHHEESLEAFNATLKIRFSPKALKGLLKDQEKRRDSRNALDGIIKLTAWQYRRYSEVSFFPSPTSTARIVLADMTIQYSSPPRCCCRYAS